MPSTGNILEIAVHSFESALIAQQGGANRLELCMALQTGGLTPDPGLISLVLEKINLPVHVLIRPRMGNFVYNLTEFKTILRSIEFCIHAGVHGVVIGCLNPDGRIHSDQVAEIAANRAQLDLTFHRAIDVCHDIYEALNVLEKHQFNRVLTSGAAPSAWEGRSQIKKMVRYTQNYQLSIMAGAGVNAQNIAQILEETGCHEIHGSAKAEITISALDPIGLTKVFQQPVNTKWECRLQEVKMMKKAITTKSEQADEA